MSRARLIPVLACLAALSLGRPDSGLLAQERKPDRRVVGINFFAAQLDHCEDRLFADVMKTSRPWTVPGEYGNGAPVAVDKNGWPKADAETIVWHGIRRMNGSYRLEGSCDREPTITPGYGGAEIVDFSYSAGKFSCGLVYSATGGDGLLLTFTGTGGGVRDVKLMRPVEVGSARSYPTSALFTDQAKRLVAKFDVVRFMWPVDGWNGPWQVAWADRVSPTTCSFNRDADTPNIGWAGKGMAWEYAIRFCNETGKDMWLNMPIGANDDYIAQLAGLVKREYKVPDGKVYWEYSNEATWDAAGICSEYLRRMGRAEAERKGPVSYDGTDDENVLAARYYAKRAAEMSAIWRKVWGDDAMMTRIRPVASGQLDYDAQLTWGLDFVQAWFGNGDGAHVQNPRPVDYYFYGCGASHYTKDNPDLLTKGVSEIAEFETYEEQEACIAKMYGLRRVAYEGGVWTSKANYRLPRIAEAMIKYHALWDAYDGDLLTYYVTTGGEDDGAALGFTMDAYSTDSQKYKALDVLVSSAKGKPTKGKLAPCEIAGADFSVNNIPWEHPAPGGKESSGPVQLDKYRSFAGFLFRIESAGTYGITLEFGGAEKDSVEILVDGKVVSRERMNGSKSPRYALSLEPGLHGIRVKALNSGNVDLKKVRIDR